jgi:lipid-binding SYLF domain-containing protein
MKRSIRISLFLITFAALISLPLQAFAWVNMGDSPRIYHTKRYAAAWTNYMASQSSTSNSTQMSMATPSNPDQTVTAASRIFHEAAMNPAKAIPAYLIKNAAGIAIFPNRVRVIPKGETYRSGVMLSHRSNGKWSSPVFVSMASGTSQAKRNAAATGVVLIFNNRSALNKAAKNDNFTLGVDASLAEGYIGSNISAAKPHAAVLAYQSTDGHFSGVSLKGSKLNVETEPTITYYNLSDGQAGANGFEAIPSKKLRQYYYLYDGQAGANGYYRSSGQGIYNKIIASTDSAEMIERHPTSVAQLREAIDDYVSQGCHTTTALCSAASR